jgi:hypothetical protein
VRLTVITLILVMTDQVTSFSGAATVSFAAEAKRPNRPHYDLVMSANDAVCKPLFALYNSMLSDALVALKTQSRTAPRLASTTSDFESQQPEKFEAIGFRTPPLVAGRPSGGIVKVDVFNDGDPRLVLFYDQLTPTIIYYGNYSTVIRILKKGISPEQLNLNGRLPDSAFEDIHADLLDWVSPDAKRNGITYGYLLRKWPHLASALRGWPNDWPKKTTRLPPILFGPISARMFINDASTVFIANEYTEIQLSERSVVVVYTLTLDGPVDVCYFKMTSDR